MMMRSTLCTLLLAYVLIVCCAPLGQASASQMIGIGYDSESPSGDYTLTLQYYDDDIISLQTSYSGEPEQSEMHRSVFIQLYTDEDSLIGQSSVISLDESLSYLDIAGTTLSDGIYLVKVLNTSMELIVQSKLAVGIVSFTVDEPSEGSISPGTGIFYIPSGSVLTADDDILYVTFDDTVLYTFTAEPPEGKVLDGWYSEGSKISSKTIIVDTEVEVRWSSSSVTYTLAYDANGGTGEPDTQTYTGTESSHMFTISGSKPVRSGYIFKGWSDTATGAVAHLPGGSITLQASSPSKTIYAVWETNPGPGPEPSYYTYTLKFDANGGEGVPDTITKTSSSSSYTFTIPSGIPTRAGYDFQGWGDTGSLPVYQPGSKITLTSSFPSKTLFAVWKETAIPDVKDFSMDVDVISIPEGSSVTIPYTVDPPEAAPGIVWTSSDETVAIVEDGIVTAVGTGNAVITAYDSHGNKLGSVSIHVASSSEKEVIETIYTSDGGSVILVYDLDDAGEMIPSNPVTIVPGTSHMVTEDQLDVVLPFIDALLQTGRDPHVVIPTDSPVSVPSELLAAIVDGNGSLTIIEGDVTLYFPWEVLDAIGCDDDLEFVILPVEVKESESTDIDVSGLDNVKVYDIYILKNGVKVAMTFPTAVTVTIDYQMKEGWTPDRLSVWYLDVEPRVSVQFEYVEGEGVVFGVMHFSHYAVSYDEGKTPADDCCVWCWILIIAVIVLILFLIWFFLWKRFKLTLTNEGGRIVSVPEGWKRESDSSISIRMRRKQEIVIPEIEAESPEGSHGMRIIGWNPSPPEKITHSMELRAVWSDGPVEMIGPQSDQE